MNIALKPLFFFIFFSQLLIINLKTLTPLSPCIKGRISQYTGWENGGKCSFEAHTNATGDIYLYPAAPNSELFSSISHCGACYEMVGPKGVIRVRVEDYCPENDESGLCSGDMNHFKVANNGTSYIMGASESSTITFRMVECGFSGNIRILTNKDSDIYWISLVVLDHNLPISAVRIQENKSNQWKLLSREEETNYWTYDPSGYEINFPIKIRIYSINRDYVTIPIDNIKGGEVYEADSNFKKVNNTFFNITTFEKEEVPDDSSKCCNADISDLSNIYRNGEVNELYYYYYAQKVKVDLKSSEKHQNKNTINATFQSSGKLVFQPESPIRTDQLSGVSIYIKATQNCSNCMYFRAYDLQNKNQNLDLNTVNGWKIYRFNFETLGVEKEFNGIILNYYKTNGKPFQIYIGSIDLIGKRDAEGVCLSIPDGSSGTSPKTPIILEPDIITDAPEITDSITTIATNINIETDSSTDSPTDSSTDSPTDSPTDSLTEIITTEIEINTENQTEAGNKELTNVNILNITSLENLPSLININCESFQKVDNENMTLLFVSNDNSNTFQTKSCNLGNEKTITKFTCKLPDNMPNGIYSIKSPSDNKYSIFYPSNAQVSNGVITFNYNNNPLPIDTTKEEPQNKTDTPNTNSTNSTEEEIPTIDNVTETRTQVTYDPIVITSSFSQTIKAGDRISFQIEQIQENKYNLNNNEIIFEDISSEKFLHFKSCQKYPSSGMISLINCLVSNNIIRGEYISVSKGQNVSIRPGNSIKFTIIDSSGGMLSQNITRTINSSAGLTSILFEILYYNPEIKPGNLFPHKVYLLGNKRSSSTYRNLEEQYDTTLLFPNCTAVSSSKEDNNAIGNIRCNLPNYVPAGTYTKLQSDGFDVNPNSILNINFPNDYNTSRLNSPISLPNKTSSSSSSKVWIIWVIAGILLLILIVIVIIACVAKKKGSDDENEESSNKDQDNSKGNMESASQDKSS